jgi:hypothetical protein
VTPFGRPGPGRSLVQVVAFAFLEPFYGSRLDGSGYALGINAPFFPETYRFLKDTTVPGARLPALIRRRPVPVNT